MTGSFKKATPATTSRGGTKWADSEWEVNNWNTLKSQARRAESQKDTGAPSASLPVHVVQAPYWGSTVPPASPRHPHSVPSGLWIPASPADSAPETVVSTPTRAAPGCVRWPAPPPQSAPSRGWSSAGLASLLSGRRTWGLPAKH